MVIFRSKTLVYQRVSQFSMIPSHHVCCYISPFLMRKSAKTTYLFQSNGGFNRNGSPKPGRWKTLKYTQSCWSMTTGSFWVPSSKHTRNYGKSQFLMENPLFLWPCSIAMSNYQRVPQMTLRNSRNSPGRPQRHHAPPLQEFHRAPPAVADTCRSTPRETFGHFPAPVLRWWIGLKWEMSWVIYSS